jgi:transposase-like protein
MLQLAIEEEVQEFLDHHDHKRDEQGRRLVVRNGYLPEREFLAPAGPLKLRQPRVRDLSKDPEEKITFSSSLLPRYLRRIKAVDDMIPWLYLNSVSANDFPSALQAVFGETAKTLSPKTIVRLKEQWTQEYELWCKRDLNDRHYDYFWVDGIHVKTRLGDEADRHQCILVIIGATADGRKELVAVAAGYPESEASWTDVLSDLKRRGLSIQPKLVIGDRALGFWAAIRKTMLQTAEQRCWVHKTVNILNKLPKSLKSEAKSDLH